SRRSLSMKIHLRPPTPHDWPAILQAANAALPWQTRGNNEWLQNRINFNPAYQRRHYIAEDIETAQLLGYGSVEGEQTPDRYRMFVVMEASLLPSVGQMLYQQLEEDLRSLGGRIAWVRE